MTRIVGLGGGIGAARLWRLLARTVDPADLTLIVNTADDLWMHGLRICPDLDTTVYALSGLQDAERGWGVRDESWRCMAALRPLGGETWFGLGDRDLAMHLLRTGMLREGAGLAAVTAHVVRELGVRVRVLPMTEQEVATWVHTPDGREMHYQEFLVRRWAAPELRSVAYRGLPDAVPTPGVLAAIADADVVVLAPSSPIASIEPIVALPGVRAALERRARDVVAVTPIVSGVPVTEAGEGRRAVARSRLLNACGTPATATGVAGRYRGLAATFVLDRADADEAGAIEALGHRVVLAETLVHLGRDPGSLVGALLGTALIG